MKLQITLVVLIMLVVFSLISASQEGSRNAALDKFQAKIPPAPQLSADDLYAQLGRAHAQIELANKYISQLQQELTAAQALCEKPEEKQEK